MGRKAGNPREASAKQQRSTFRNGGRPLLARDYVVLTDGGESPLRCLEQYGTTTLTTLGKDLHMEYLFCLIYAFFSNITWREIPLPRLIEQVSDMAQDDGRRLAWSKHCLSLLVIVVCERYRCLHQVGLVSVTSTAAFEDDNSGGGMPSVVGRRRQSTGDRPLTKLMEGARQ